MDATIGKDKPLFDMLEPGSIVLVDRLGRSGTCKFPIAGHYQPCIKARASAAQVDFLALPPTGALVNPIELAWAYLKKLVAHMRPPGNPEDAREQIIRGPRNLAEALPMIKAAALEMNATRACSPHSFTAAEVARSCGGATRAQRNSTQTRVRRA